MNQTETDFLAAGGDASFPQRREEMTSRQMGIWHECERLWKSVTSRGSLKGTANRFKISHVLVEDRIAFYERYRAVFERPWTTGQTMINLLHLWKMAKRVLRVQVADVEAAHRQIEALHEQMRKDGNPLGTVAVGEDGALERAGPRETSIVRGAAIRTAGLIHAGADLVMKIHAVAADQKAERDEALKRVGARADGAATPPAVAQKDQLDALRLLRGVG